MRRRTAAQLFGRTVAHCYSAAVERELEQSSHKPDFPYVLFKSKCLAVAALMQFRSEAESRLSHFETPCWS